jgi:hypothetical protein
MITATRKPQLTQVPPGVLDTILSKLDAIERRNSRMSEQLEDLRLRATRTETRLMIVATALGFGEKLESRDKVKM